MLFLFQPCCCGKAIIITYSECVVIQHAMRMRRFMLSPVACVVLTSFIPHYYYYYLLLLVFSPWAGLDKDQRSVRRLVWLWYAGRVLRGSLPLLSHPFLDVPTFYHQVPPRPPRRERSQRRKWELWARMLSGNFA